MLSLEVRTAISEAAEKSGLDPAKLAAIIEVESAGIIFWIVNGEKKPTILTEAHYFWRLTSGEARRKAVAAGLANPRWGAIPYPRTAVDTWSRYERMAAIDPVAAMSSCSWGVGQVMGDKWKGLGYESPQAFIDAQMTLPGQIDALLREIKYSKLEGALGRGGFTGDSWRDFARGYNGSGYAKNNYHNKMAAFYKNYVSVDFELGGIDEGIKLIQQQLKDAGYWSSSIDGKYSTDYLVAVKKFQADHALEDDGVVGPLTSAALIKASNAGQHSSANGAIRGGAIAVSATSIGHEIINQLQPIQSMPIKVLQIMASVGIFVAIGLIAYGMYKRAQFVTVEQEQH